MAIRANRPTSTMLWKKYNVFGAKALVVIALLVAIHMFFLSGSSWETILPAQRPTTQRPGNTENTGTSKEDFDKAEGTFKDTPTAAINSPFNPTYKAPSPNPRPFTKTNASKMHYFVFASQPNLSMCFLLTTSLALGYPPPVFIGWGGEGELDAKKTHLAKLRNLQAHFARFTEDMDDDIALIVDGYDVIMQLPPEAMLERYFEQNANYNEVIADRMGVSVEEARERGRYQTIMLGPDKVCFPTDWKLPRCWAVPDDVLGKGAFGPKTGNGDVIYMQPRWLNSGTIIGPVGHLKAYLNATMKKIDETWDAKFRLRNSDQMYMADVWAEQEFFRSLEIAGSRDKVKGGGGDRIYPKSEDGEGTEFHVGLDYQNALFQDKVGYDKVQDFTYFNETGMSTKLDRNIREEENFETELLPLAEDVRRSLGRLYTFLPETYQSRQSPEEWLQQIHFGFNYVTKQVYSLFHLTGSKDTLPQWYERHWVSRFAKSMTLGSVNEAVAQWNGDCPIHSFADGKEWVGGNNYPEDIDDPYGGGWTDGADGAGMKWQNYGAMCGEFTDKLFKGEKDEMSKAH